HPCLRGLRLVWVVDDLADSLVRVPAVHHAVACGVGERDDEFATAALLLLVLHAISQQVDAEVLERKQLRLFDERLDDAARDGAVEFLFAVELRDTRVHAHPRGEVGRDIRGTNEKGCEFGRFSTGGSTGDRKGTKFVYLETKIQRIHCHYS